MAESVVNTETKQGNEGCGLAVRGVGRLRPFQFDFRGAPSPREVQSEIADVETCESHTSFMRSRPMEPEKQERIRRTLKSLAEAQAATMTLMEKRWR